MRCVADGTCAAVAAWVDALPFAGGEDDEDEEGEEWVLGGTTDSSRRQRIHLLPAPVSLRAGQEVRLQCEVSAAGIRFFLGAGHGAVPLEAEDAPAAKALGARVERWHFPMINDRRRNECYEAGIRRAVEDKKAQISGRGGDGSPPSGRGPAVLDIGAGTGLLGMMAARAGAAKVTSVERVAALAACATAICEANGLGSAVRVLHAESTQISAADLHGGAAADVLVSEIFDDGLLGEHVLPSVADARRRLCRADATVVPAAADVWAMGVEVVSSPFVESGTGGGPAA